MLILIRVAISFQNSSSVNRNMELIKEEHIKTEYSNYYCKNPSSPSFQVKDESSKCRIGIILEPKLEDPEQKNVDPLHSINEEVKFQPHDYPNSLPNYNEMHKTCVDELKIEVTEAGKGNIDDSKFKKHEKHLENGCFEDDPELVECVDTIISFLLEDESLVPADGNADIETQEINTEIQLQGMHCSNSSSILQNSEHPSTSEVNEGETLCGTSVCQSTSINK